MKWFSLFVLSVMYVGLMSSCSSSSDDCDLYCSKMFELDAGGTWHCKIIETIDVNGRCKAREIYRPCEKWYGENWECNEVNQVCFSRSITAERYNADGKTCRSDDECDGLPCAIGDGQTVGVCTLEGLPCEKSLDCLSPQDNYICSGDGLCTSVGRCDNGCVISKNQASSYDLDKWVWFSIYNPSDDAACMDQCDLNTVGDPMPQTLEGQLNDAGSLFDFQQALMNVQCSISSLEK